jgi:hypothetical protein
VEKTGKNLQIQEAMQAYFQDTIAVISNLPFAKDRLLVFPLSQFT